ncbi:IclR family transcriptional regulator [Rhodosalinus sediminis]|uniref:IclR family transcriptional regulator n=1 Tax=Rhodosalinus sediminis TaxID=1940533 RepID=A0A3D9BU72_9RHOB|nr:helix-turn-helix domain-containing protein [Rhodosalinus sediminis]REC57069.1 IclR family transcriptional regulator [Rhodosalinus sediminis]
MPNSTDIPPSDTSLTFAKGLAVLECFNTATTALGVPEIARRCGLDRAVARRLVLTLVRAGYVRQRGRAYALCPGSLVLAAGLLQGQRFGLTVQPVLEGFAAQARQPLMLTLRDGHDAVYVAHAGGPGILPRLGFTLGSRLPLLSTAVGRAMLGAETPGARAKLLAEAPLTAWTERTVTERSRLAQVVAETPPGTAVRNDGEFEPGITATAVGFRCESGEVAAVGHSAERALYAEPGTAERIETALVRCAEALRTLL